MMCSPHVPKLYRSLGRSKPPNMVIAYTTKKFLKFFYNIFWAALCHIKFWKVYITFFTSRYITFFRFLKWISHNIILAAYNNIRHIYLNKINSKTYTFLMNQENCSFVKCISKLNQMINWFDSFHFSTSTITLNSVLGEGGSKSLL